MIFRATQKVSSKLRIACTAIVDSHPSMVEWYCNLITVRRDRHTERLRVYQC